MCHFQKMVIYKLSFVYILEFLLFSISKIVLTLNFSKAINLQVYLI